MGNNGILIEEMDVASVRGNEILSLGADRETVRRCRAAIDQFGAVAPPVVGALADGARVVLSGECEFAAIRETGARRMAAVSAKVPAGGGAKAALLLSSLRKGPGALSEGMLLREALDGGATRSELGGMLGRSASWVSNRLALATRLDGGVREMLMRGLLDARSAQEIARLPGEAQFAFAERAVREGLPKSAIEALVAGYNDGSCPDGAKEQILRDPRAALARVSDKRRAVRAPSKSGGMPMLIEEAKAPLSRLAQALCFASPAEASPMRRELGELRKDLAALLEMVQNLLYPGKKEVAANAAN